QPRCSRGMPTCVARVRPSLMTPHLEVMRSVLASFRTPGPASRGPVELAKTRVLPVICGLAPRETDGCTSRRPATPCNEMHHCRCTSLFPREPLFLRFWDLGFAQSLGVLCEQILKRLSEEDGLRNPRSRGQFLHRRPHFW